MEAKPIFFFGLLLLYTISDVCEAVRCFQCKDRADSLTCTHVTSCADGEECYIAEVLTSTGHIVFQSGCMANAQCSALTGLPLGRRSLSKRVGPITKCIECCNGDFCNLQGCGQKAKPRDQRGPYCYTCDVSSPDQPCRDVTVCGRTQVCGLYEPHKFYGLYTHLVYESSCMSKLVCDAIHHAIPNSETGCIPTCCNTDFCNTKCNGTSTV